MSSPSHVGPDPERTPANHGVDRTGRVVATLVRDLARHDLVDEYRLLLFPIVLGAGKRMFDERAHLARFELRESVATPAGVVALTYVRL